VEYMHYDQALGVSETAFAADIKIAYRKLNLLSFQCINYATCTDRIVDATQAVTTVCKWRICKASHSDNNQGAGFH